MSEWKSLLNDDPTGWLLEESDPSVRYFTLRWLMDKPEEDSEVLAASRSIAGCAPVKKILKKQRPAGYWGSDPNPHAGSRGHLLLLAWLGFKGNVASSRSMQAYLDNCITENGSYAVTLKGRTIYIPCHAANLLRMMVWFGFAGDPRGPKILDWLLGIQQADGVWPCISKLRPFPCLWATACVLRAIQDLPGDWVTPAVEAARWQAIELFLNSGLSQYGKEKPSPLWYQFGFPLQWDTDILEVLELIAPFISPNEPRIQKDLGVVLEKQDPAGRWPREKYPKGGTWMQQYVDFEEIGQPSKWVTLHAMKMLKLLYN